MKTATRVSITYQVVQVKLFSNPVNEKYLQ